MKPQRRVLLTATVLILILAFGPIGFGTSAGLETPNAAPVPDPPPVTAVLTTRGNRPIMVNGSSAVSGATILSGAIIETPDQVGGEISLGLLSNLEIEPNSKLTLEFDKDGNVKVTLVRGCATVRTKKNVLGEVYTSQGLAGKTDTKARGFLNVCFPWGAAAPTVVAGGAAVAVAGGGGLLGKLLVVFGGVGVLTGGLLILRGDNPSPSNP